MSPMLKHGFAFYLNLLINVVLQCGICQDFIVNIGPNTGYKTNEYLGCTSRGCSVTKTWLVNGSCVNPVLTVKIVETDFGSSVEFVHIDINNDEIGSCEPLNQHCSYDWITCDITPYNLTQKVNLESPGATFSVKLDISAAVDACPYVTYDGTEYYLYGEVILQCEIPSNVTTAAPTTDPTMSPTTPTVAPSTAPTIDPTAAPIDYTWNIDNASLPFRFSQSFGCVGTGCSVSKLFAFDGRCDNPWMTISIIETDLSTPSSEYIDVYLNYNLIGTCVGDEDCTFDEVTCTNFERYNISSYVDNPLVNSYTKLRITLDGSYAMGYISCRYNSMYDLWATVTFGCSILPNMTSQMPTFRPSGNPTAPTTVPARIPTGTPTDQPTNVDYYFYPGRNGNYTDAQRFGCTKRWGCDVEKGWLIVGECINPKLTIDVVETDIGSSLEYVSIYINNIYIGECEALDEDCTQNWITCPIADRLNLSSIVDLDATNGWFTVLMSSSILVNTCPYEPGDGNSYYMYGQVTIHCSVPPSPNPSQYPSQSPSIAPSLSPSQVPTLTPSISPTTLPSTTPTAVPTTAPTRTPSSSPTNTYCDEGFQTNSTFIVCKLLFSLHISTFDYNSLNYCDNTDYFKCSNGNTSISHIFVNDGSVTGSFNLNTMIYLNQAIKNGLIWLDLSNNGISDQISDWSAFSQLQYLSLANNKIEGSVDFNQLINKNVSSLRHIELNSNNFHPQTVSWSAFEFIPNLEYFDISNNSFFATIEISYFQYCQNLKYFNVAYNLFTSFDDFDESITDTYIPKLEEFIINNNEIDEQFDMKYFSSNNKLKTIKCNNNSLINSKLDMGDIPSSLDTFVCGNNDFGEFIWDSSPYEEYSLKHIDLTNARIYGQITMKVFDNDDGGYKYLEYIDFSNNENLNISIDFMYLDGQSYLSYLNFLNTDAHGHVNFEYLSDSIANNVTIILDTDIYCVNSYCGSNSDGKNYGFTRDYEACYSKQHCLDSCSCETAYTVGLEKFVPSQFGQTSFVVLIVVVCTLSLVVVLGTVHASGLDCSIPVGNRTDYFEVIGFLTFIFQIWDLFSDLLLCFEIFDHYNQASSNNPKKDDYFRYSLLCFTFIFVPWTVNLIFLIKTKRAWEKDSIDHSSTSSAATGAQNVDALTNSSITTSNWLNKYSKILVLICMISGGLPASLKVVNSNLFGLKQFNMGLPKYKQDENARHRLWLTIVLENVPQIVISTLYATKLAGFDTTVLAALISSTASVVLALLSAYLEYPKKYFIYQMGIELKSSHNTQLIKRLKMRKELSKVICESMDREKGFVFVENVHYNGKDFVCFNVVSNEHIIITTMDVAKQQKMSKLLLQNSKLRIECDTIIFTFVCFKSVSLLPHCICKGSSTLTSENDSANARANDSEKVMSEIVLSNTKHTDDAQNNADHDIDVMDDKNIVQWNLWTAKQVNKWVELKLRIGMSELNISEVVNDKNCNQNDDDDKNVDQMDKKHNDPIVFADKEQEILADKFMTKFKSLSISGAVILEMKNSDKLMNKVETTMSELSCVLWFIVSKAIDGLELPNENNDNNDRLDVGEDVEVVFVAEKSVKSLAQA